MAAHIKPVAMSQEQLNLLLTNNQQIQDKLDKTVDKFQELSQITTEILARHDANIDTLKARAAEQQARMDNEQKRIDQKMDTIKDDIVKAFEELFVKSIREQIKGIEDSNKALQARIAALEKVRWILAGAAMVIGFLLKSSFSLPF